MTPGSPEAKTPVPPAGSKPSSARSGRGSVKPPGSAQSHRSGKPGSAHSQKSAGSGTSVKPKSSKASVRSTSPGNKSNKSSKSGKSKKFSSLFFKIFLFIYNFENIQVCSSLNLQLKSCHQ